MRADDGEAVAQTDREKPFARIAPEHALAEHLAGQQRRQHDEVLRRIVELDLSLLRLRHAWVREPEEVRSLQGAQLITADLLQTHGDREREQLVHAGCDRLDARALVEPRGGPLAPVRRVDRVEHIPSRDDHVATSVAEGLASGTEDMWAKAHRLLGQIVPSDHVFSGPGGHAWTVWSPLWTRMLDAGAIADSPVAPPGE